ncbi:MAG: hypothetical protein WD249_06735 [Gaiellaceae bacterium]
MAALARHRFLLVLAAAPALAALAQLLPDTGIGLAIRLTAAAACVLVVPGALIQRALGWPESAGVAAAGVLAWSLVAVFAALAVTFTFGASLTLALGLLAVTLLAALVPGRVAAGDARAALLVGAAGVVFAVVVWYAHRGDVSGDGLFHLARARKLAELDSLSVGAVSEFRDGGPHPGYAFPLWHGVLAMVARVGGVDPALVVQHLAAVLTPPALVVGYGAGAALFRSWGGGVAVAIAQAAQLGFARAGTGSFAFLALPASVGRVLLAPALLALVFAATRRGAPRTLYASVAAAGLALAVVHPTYVLFVGLVLAGYLAVRPRRRLAVALAAVAVPAGLFLLWLLPVVRDTIPHLPSAAERAGDFARYAAQLDGDPDSFRLAPRTISRGGAAAVAALLVVPLAAFARRRVAAFVLGGSLAVLVVLLVPALFTQLADVVSLSQGRRLAQFLPLPFALAAAALLAGQLRLAGVAIGLALGIGLQLAYPGSFNYGGGDGPAYPVWIALIGGGLALLLLWRRPTVRAEPAWGVAVIAAFALPVAVAGLGDVQTDAPPDRYGLTPGLVAELRRLPEGDIVFAPLEASYRVAAYAPLYVAAAPPAHVARTTANRPYERRVDVVRFFDRAGVTDSERRAILDRYGADWLLVDRTRRYPESFVTGLGVAYEDGRYALYRVSAS